uniref:Uncharacterized protein n=1 Tax=Sphaerodactylus townsendi TaxID=933632 RepID=A0ACB8E6Y8_9SAUR
MAADITLLFKASVKTVKTRNKALGVSLGGGGGGGGGGGDDPLLLLKRAGNARPKGDFSGRARDVYFLLNVYGIALQDCSPQDIVTCRSKQWILLGALRRQFEDPFEEEKARARLRQIRQGSRSMSECVSEFHQLAGVVQDWPEQVKIHF